MLIYILFALVKVNFSFEKQTKEEKVGSFQILGPQVQGKRGSTCKNILHLSILHFMYLQKHFFTFKNNVVVGLGE